MLRLLFPLLVLLCACAGPHPVPPADVARPVDQAEPLDPGIKPLSQEMDEQAE